MVLTKIQENLKVFVILGFILSCVIIPALSLCDTGWNYYIPYNVSNPIAIDQTYEGEILNVSGLSLASGNANYEIRVRQCEEENSACGTDVQIPVDIIDTDNSTWAKIAFQYNLTASKWRYYLICYDNAGASDPAYSDSMLLWSNLTNTCFKFGDIEGNFDNAGGLIENYTYSSTQIMEMANDYGMPSAYANSGWVTYRTDVDDTCTTVFDGFIYSEVNCTTGEIAGGYFNHKMFSNKNAVDIEGFIPGYAWMYQYSTDGLWDQNVDYWLNVSTEGKFTTGAPGTYRLENLAQENKAIGAYQAGETWMYGHLFNYTQINNIGTVGMEGGASPFDFTIFVGRNTTGFPYIPAGTTLNSRIGIFTGTAGTTLFNNESEIFMNHITGSLGSPVFCGSEFSESYTSPAYETDITIFGFNATNTTTTDINATLIWNGTSYNTTESSDTETWNFTASVPLPLILINATNYTFYWTYNKTWNNGTTYEYNYTPHNQTVNYAYEITGLLNSPSDVLEGDSFTSTVTITKQVNNAWFTGLVDFNGSNSTGSFSTNSSASAVYSVSLTAPSVNTTTNYTVIPYANVTHDGVTRLMSLATSNVTVYPMNITSSCALGDAAIIFYSKHEDNATTGPVLHYETHFTTYNGAASQEYNFTFTGNTTYWVCLVPTWLTFDIDMESQYSNSSGYATREYYFENNTLSNSTTTIDLYSHPEARTDSIEFTVRDSSNLVQSGVIIQANRYFIGENQYRIVAMGRSDDWGKTVIPLQTSDTWYQLILVDEDTVLSTYNQMVLTGDPVTLYTGVTSSQGYYDYYDSVAVSCYNSTVGDALTLACTVSDTSNSVNYYELQVKRLFSISNFTTCTNTLSAASGTLTCTITNYTNANYAWDIIAYFESDSPEPVVILDNGIIERGSTLVYNDSMGLFLTAVLSLVMGGIGLFSGGVPGAVIGSDIGLILGVVLGIVNVGFGISALVGLTVIGLVITFKGGQG